MKLACKRWVFAQFQPYYLSNLDDACLTMVVKKRQIATNSQAYQIGPRFLLNEVGALTLLTHAIHQANDDPGELASLKVVAQSNAFCTRML